MKLKNLRWLHLMSAKMVVMANSFGSRSREATASRWATGLRRVLLSSLPGAAVTYVKIDGVLHEFATIPGVREDVADIILNIKALCLKMEGEGEKILRIECSGEQEVTAANIIADSDVEILNLSCILRL